MSSVVNLFHYRVSLAGVLVLFIVGLMTICVECAFKPREEKTKCPSVKALRNFDLEKLMGSWYVVQYYASSEEELAYKCMRFEFSMAAGAGAGADVDHHHLVHLNFSYMFTDDPDKERLLGNITWIIPDNSHPAHWIHMEDTYEGVYNTYVLDSDYSSWSLMLHCAEITSASTSSSPRGATPCYLSSLVMSRTPRLAPQVVAFLRDKLPRYDIDLHYMFNMSQHHCASSHHQLHYAPPSQHKMADAATASRHRSRHHQHPIRPNHHRAN